MISPTLLERPGGTRLRVAVRVRWSDLDAYGHVNNVAMLTLLEEARVDGLWCLGRDGELVTNALAGGPGAPVRTYVVHQEIEYRGSLGYPHEPIGIEVWVPRVRAASIEVAYEVPGVLLATTTLALVDAGTGRPVRVPARLVQAWAPLRGERPRFRHAARG